MVAAWAWATRGSPSSPAPSTSTLAHRRLKCRRGMVMFTSPQGWNTASGHGPTRRGGATGVASWARQVASGKHATTARQSTSTRDGSVAPREVRATDTPVPGALIPPLPAMPRLSPARPRRTRRTRGAQCCRAPATGARTWHRLLQGWYAARTTHYARRFGLWPRRARECARSVAGGPRGRQRAPMTPSHEPRARRLPGRRSLASAEHRRADAAGLSAWAPARSTGRSTPKWWDRWR